MNKTTVLSITIGIIILAIIGSIYAYRQFKKMFNYCFSVNYKKTRIKSIDKNGLNIDVAVDLKNSSNINVIVHGYKFDMLLNGKKIGDISSVGDFKWDANKINTIFVNMSMNFNDLINKKIIGQDTILNILIGDKSKVILTIVGNISVEAMGVNIKELPINISSSLKDYLTPSTEPTTECK